MSDFFLCDLTVPLELLLCARYCVDAQFQLVSFVLFSNSGDRYYYYSIFINERVTVLGSKITLLEIIPLLSSVTRVQI